MLDKMAEELRSLWNNSEQFKQRKEYLKEEQISLKA
jgi:hypothetical protein